MFCPANAPGLFVTGRAGSHLNTMCHPPRGVTSVWVFGGSPCFSTSAAQTARPSGSSGFLGGSGSTAHTPERDPIGTPIIACGHWPHQLRIVASSVVASLNPRLVSGALFVGLTRKNRPAPSRVIERGVENVLLARVALRAGLQIVIFVCIGRRRRSGSGSP